MDIAPDTKDWTWVLERPCPDCGFDAQRISPADVPRLLRANAGAWLTVLDGPDADVRRRPAHDVWSPLEYACHVRDVARLFDQRLQLLLAETDPLFPNWDQDETAVSERYGEQAPARVRGELHAAAETLAQRFDEVSGAQWDRPGRRSDGARFTVTTFARYLLHDLIHHEYDVTGRRADSLDSSGTP